MRILVVEDEIGLSDAIAKILMKQNYTVDQSFDGVDGLYQALTGIYDAILLDIMLPGKNGFEVVRTLRSEGVRTPVLMLTARSELQDKVKGLNLGADDYLTKPFETEELLARVRAVSRRKGEIMDSILSLSDLELDTKKGEITCTATGQSMQLGAKEFQMMEMFLANHTQVLTKEQMIEKIWGYESDAEYNNVEVYISFLRKKLAFIGTAVKIVNKRGIGYSLEVER